MKTKLLITLLLLASTVVQAREVLTLNDLLPNDTLSLKVTIADGVVGHNSIWDFDQVQKVEIQFNVLSVHKDTIRLGVMPANWFAHFQNENQYNLVPYNGFRVFGYFDTFVLGYYGSGEGEFEKFRDNNVVVSINKNDGGANVHFKPIPQDNAIFSHDRKRWDTPFIPMQTGVKIIKMSYPPVDYLNLEFDNVLKSSIQEFARAWINKSKEGSPMPWSVDLRDITREIPQTPTFVQVVSASFDLPPNVYLTYKTSKDIPEDRVFIVNGNERIKPIKKESDGKYVFNFFMPSPKRLTLDGVLLDLTPDDSVSVAYNLATESYTFDGKGSANSAYINDIVKYYKEEKGLREFDFRHVTYPDWNDLSQAEINDYFAKGKARHKNTLAKYAKEMNPYWVRSAELSYNYWYLSEKMYIKNRATTRNFGNFFKPIAPQYDIDWTVEEFGAVFPLSDYLYQPYTYGYFLNNYSDYKALQMSDDMLIGVMNNPLGHIPKYKFVNAIFWGYPKFYLMSETLKYLMTDFELSMSQRAYEDFLRVCAEPELRKTIISMHEQLEKAEPGANIKGLELAMEKYIPLKNKADDYIVLLVDDGEMNPFDMSLYLRDEYKHKESDKENDYLREKITVCVITSQSRKALFESKPNLKKYITVVPDEILRDYHDKVISSKGCYIIMRDDGTILSRTLAGQHDYGVFILSTVQEDIEKLKNQDTASGGILVVILSSLTSILITYLIVRRVIERREQTKRRISELELKAIRAQMNPHFTFNALGSIQNLINQKKEKEANDYLVNFSKLLRMVLSTSEKKLITLSEEVEQLELYLRLEQLRVPFQYTIDIAENIDIENEEIPGMLIQPIVENAVKHAIVPKGGGQIKLNFSKNNQMLLVTVADSGNGYLDADSRLEKGFGLQAVQERLNLLKKELKLEIGLKIENIETDGKIEGCMITISIPV